MLSKRIIPCLDVRDGRLTKGIKFKENVDIGDPVEAAREYYEQGADEIVFYDITGLLRGPHDHARRRKKGCRDDLHSLFPWGRHRDGGGDAAGDPRGGGKGQRQFRGGAKNHGIIAEGARAFGASASSSHWMLKSAASKEIPSGYEMVIHGGRTVNRPRRAPVGKGGGASRRGEICLNSIDADGTQDGYELDLTALISSHVGIPVIASGGAGSRSISSMSSPAEKPTPP